MGVYPLLRPLLFALDAERAHRLTFATVAALARVPGALPAVRAALYFEHPSLRTMLWGRALGTPLGLAAGFDKDGLLIAPLDALGFGFLEVGTVTPWPQPGNPRPRLFRLPEDLALINRMGFNNRGAEALADRLARLEGAGLRAPIGVNLGRNRDTPNERAREDYTAALRAVHRHAAYAVVNVSSPNTPGLRALQDRDSLRDLLAALRQEEARLAARTGRRVPLLLKVAPDLESQALAGLAGVALAERVDGLIATNTTLTRPGLRAKPRDEPGGLSGRPLFGLALETVRRLRRLTHGDIPIVAAGGIFTGEDAYAMIRAGASAVQIYTALIYGGPGVVRRIKQELVELLRRDGFAQVEQAVGRDVEASPHPPAGSDA